MSRFQIFIKQSKHYFLPFLSTPYLLKPSFPQIRSVRNFCLQRLRHRLETPHQPLRHRLRLPYLEVVSRQSKYGPPLSQYFQLSLRNESCENLLFRNSFYFLFSSTTMYFITTSDCLGIVAKIWTAENHMTGHFHYNSINISTGSK